MSIHFRRAGIALAVAATLAACGPNTTGGTIAGGLAGAGVGGIVGGGKGAAIGAGVGALTGAAIGASLDRQQAELDARLRGSGARVDRRGDRIVVSLAGDVTFNVDSARIKPAFYGPLEDIAQTLNDYPESAVDIKGYTDNTGDRDYNRRLSLERAEAVADFLAGRGVLPARIQLTGRGERDPVASNDTAAGRAANRRVEITILPRG
jgi:outer membrane protein OmpA-like peptidoglycan-associated protein